MKSKASIRSHPIHPMLIAFPVAFFSGTFIFDVIGRVSGTTDYWQTATHLEIAGVISALIAAVPGIIDYTSVVPPNSSAKKRGAQHGALNTIHVLIFFTAWCIRDDHKESWLIPGLEFMGLVILSVAGWLGGTMVYRNQIGVDIRYANAGKWKELKVAGASDAPLEVAHSGELELNQMKLIHVNGKRIVIAKTEKGFVAFDDHCTHRGGSLAGGSMICGTVQCPWHGSQFDVHTGAVKAGPAGEQIQTYRLDESAGKVYLYL